MPLDTQLQHMSEYIWTCSFTITNITLSQHELGHCYVQVQIDRMHCHLIYRKDYIHMAFVHMYNYNLRLHSGAVPFHSLLAMHVSLLGPCKV